MRMRSRVSVSGWTNPHPDSSLRAKARPGGSHTSPPNLAKPGDLAFQAQKGSPDPEPRAASGQEPSLRPAPPIAALEGWSLNGQLASEQKSKASLVTDPEKLWPRPAPFPRWGPQCPPKARSPTSLLAMGSQGSRGLSRAFQGAELKSLCSPPGHPG